MGRIISRTLSLILAAAYVLPFVAHARDWRDLCACGYPVLLLLVPLSFIWYPEYVGAMKGYLGHGALVDTETPAFLVSAAGWVLLLAPIGVFWSSLPEDRSHSLVGFFRQYVNSITGTDK